MIKFEPIYLRCPQCNSWLEGHKLRSEMVNSSILYSDGKTLNDDYIITPQKIIICPACSHWFWIEHYEEPAITTTKPTEWCYGWNTWRFFGVHFASNEGKAALIEHYKSFLTSIHNIEREIYLRRMLWWAYNDLVRNFYQASWNYLFSGEMSFNVWRKNRNKIFKGMWLFRHYHEEYIDNCIALLRLVENRYSPSDDEYERSILEIMELYRETGQYGKAQEILDKVPRRTHYIANIEKKVKQKKDFVFLVVG